MLKIESKKATVEVTEDLSWEVCWQAYVNFPMMVLKTIQAWEENFGHVWGAVPVGDSRLLVVAYNHLLFMEGEKVIARKELDSELANEIVNDFDDQLEEWALFEAGEYNDASVIEAELTLLLADVKKRLWDL